MMPQATKEKSVYGEQFRSLKERANGNDPAWMARLRESAFARFEESGFPTTDVEDWKYTNVAPIARVSFRPASEVETGALAPEAIEKRVYDETRQSRLVFMNGLFQPQFSTLEALGDGIVASDIESALAGEHAEVLRERFSRLAADEGGAFVDLNTAFARDGAFLYVPAGVRSAAPVQLLFLSADAGQESAAFPRVIVVVERGGELDLIESYASTDDADTYFTNVVVEVFVGDGARLTHCKVQDESERAYHVATTRADLGRDAFYDSTTVTLGARLSRHDIEVRLDHEGAECFVDGLYIVGGEQHTDTHSLIDHRKPHCVSHQNYKGILDGKSRAVFNGKVFVRRDAQQTDAQQSNKNLLLSREARVDTKPQLEIFADDVKCAHGATVGQLEEEELFYLLSRGLHPDLARNLLTYGFAEEVVEKIKFDSIRAQLDEAILNRLHARLEV